MPQQTTKCPISRGEFHQHATPLQVTLGGVTLDAEPKDFTSGAFGYYAGQKITLEIGGKRVTFQVGLNIVAVGSKEAKE